MTLRNRPTAAALLTTARRALLDDLLPLLPQERHYEALLVAMAMRIAIAEQDAGDPRAGDPRAGDPRADDDWLAQVDRDLAGLYGEGGRGQAGGDVARLYRRFAADLRAGVFDAAGPRTAIAHAILRTVAHHKLLENNPKYPRTGDGSG